MAAAVSTLDRRTAIVHDWFQGYHGSERVVEAMRQGLFAPGNEPDIFTFHAARELLPEELARAIVRESRLSRLPGIRQRWHDPGRWRYLLPYMPFYFRRLDLSAYDVVITSSHACANQVRPPKSALHVCYCYTPMRYAWLPDTERERTRGAARYALGGMRTWLRRIDYQAAQRPDVYVALSQAVVERIRRFYGRDAHLVHPPVETGDFRSDVEKEPGSFLWVHRLVAYKHPLLVAEAFRDLPYRLTMVGVGPLEAELRRSLPPNVELHGWLSRPELAELYARASGFVHIGEEDFGISMVEALASGTPVIALDAGGARDIVRDGVDGVLLSEPSVEQLRAAVRHVAATEWDRGVLTERAREFGPDRFVERMSRVLQDALADRS